MASLQQKEQQQQQQKKKQQQVCRQTCRVIGPCPALIGVGGHGDRAAAAQLN
jgi:uncharacterized FAD-dependent dehydrogenase